jgi:hypothetical protein
MDPRHRYDGLVTGDLGQATSRGWATPRVILILRLAAILGVALGIETVVLHLLTDPLADVHAYYDAGTRLNAGQALYDQPATTDDAAFYRYPPLLAIAFRPLALLPFPAAAAIWELLLVGAMVLTLVRLGPRRQLTWMAFGMLALPLGWSLVIGQAQVLVTLLLALGTPWGIAFATNLKVFPILAATWWIGRRDWRGLRQMALWLIGVVVVQLVLEPAGSLAYLGFLRLEQVGNVQSISPYALSPLLWAALLAVGIIAAIRLAPRRHGWAVAVVVAVFASPRLLVYQLSSLIAAVRDPDDR